MSAAENPEPSTAAGAPAQQPDRAELAKISETFSRLREQQADLAQEAGRVEDELREFNRVMDALSKMPDDRTAFQTVNDSLVETTVQVAREQLTIKINNLQALSRQLTEKLESKGRELIAYKEKHGIRIVTPEEHAALQKRQQQQQQQQQLAVGGKS